MLHPIFKYSEQCCRLFNLCVSACYFWIQFHKHQKSVDKTTCNYNSYYIRHINADFVFTDFVIGAYSAQQPFSVQLLSKTAYFGDMKGFDSFYLAAVTACIFVFVTAVLISVSNCIVNTSSKRTLVFVSIIALIMFVLFVCADSYNAVKELLLNNIFLTVLNFISALLIPIIYLLYIGESFMNKNYFYCRLWQLF